jgi:hypothetical protein
MDDKLVVMPAEQELLQRLRDGLDEELQSERLFSIICRALAGKELYLDGIVTALVLAIGDYDSLSPAGWNLMSPEIPKLLEALIGDETDRRTSIEYYQELVDDSRAA